MSIPLLFLLTRRWHRQWPTRHHA